MTNICMHATSNHANCSCRLIVCTSRSRHYDDHLVCWNDDGGTTLLWTKILNIHCLYCTLNYTYIEGWLIEIVLHNNWNCLTPHINLFTTFGDILDLIASVKVSFLYMTSFICETFLFELCRRQLSESAVVMANNLHLATDLKYTSLSIRCRCWRELVSRCSVNYDDVSFGKQRQTTHASGASLVFLNRPQGMW